MEIKVDEEFKAQIPSLSDSEKRQLEKNIIENGCRDPLVVWGDILLDGHNRLDICNRNDIEYSTVSVELSDREEAADWIDRNQIGRRNLSPDAFRLAIGRIYNRTKKQGARTDLTSDQNDTKSQTADTLAEQYGTSPATVKRSGKAAEAVEGTPIANAVTSGEAKLNEGADLAGAMRQSQPQNSTYTLDEAKEELKRQKQQKHQERDAKRREAKADETRAATTGEYRIIRGDAFTDAEQVGDIDLLITDPPYSTDIDDIASFVKWMDAWLPKIKNTGRAYIFTGAYPDELRHYLNQFERNENYGLTLDNVLVWTYRNTIGPSPKTGYKLNWQACFYLHGADAPDLNCPEMVEQFTVQDVNAPDARTGVRYHGWQKPDEIAERLIRHGSNDGAFVVDPFCGTGTFIAAASKLGRSSFGIEQSEDMLNLCKERGLEVES